MRVEGLVVALTNGKVRVEIPELNSTENKSKRDKLSKHVRLRT